MSHFKSAMNFTQDILFFGAHKIAASIIISNYMYFLKQDEELYITKKNYLNKLQFMFEFCYLLFVSCFYKSGFIYLYF